MKQAAAIKNLLIQTARRLHRSLDLAVVHQELRELIESVFDIHGLYVAVYEGESQEIRCEFAVQQEEIVDVAALPTLKLNPEKKGLQTRVILSGKAIIVDDYLEYLASSKQKYQVEKDGSVRDISHSDVDESDPDITRSAMLVPVKIGEEVVGVIQFQSNRLKAFSESDLELVEAISSHYAVARQNAILHNRLESELEKRRQAEHDREQAVRQDKAIVKALPDLVIRQKRDGTYTFLHVPDPGMLTLNEGISIGRNIRDMGYSPDYVEEQLNLVGRCLDTGTTQRHRYQLEVKKGMRHFEATIVPYDKDEILYLTRDITDRVESDRQVRQAQKMEALGQFAGGIAHDFNNILQSLFLHIEALKPESSADQIYRKTFESIDKDGERAKRLVRQILEFSRDSNTRHELISACEITREAVNFLKASIPANIELVENIGDDCYPVKAHSSELYQILLNLGKNAVQAMGDKGGKLHVSLHNYAEGLPNPQSHPQFVQLEVKDEGTGMEQQVLEQIFDPFFTTKKRGEGTGFGLSMVQKIVHDLEGELLVESQPGEGSRFTLLIPGFPGEDLHENESKEKVDIGTVPFRILFVDDEDNIRQTLSTLLKRRGFEVDTAADGQAAFEMLQARPEAYDLLITDQSMPKMSGLDLIEAVREWAVDLPVLLSTGNLNSVDQARAERLGVIAVIKKPWSFADLFAQISKYQA